MGTYTCFEKSLNDFGVHHFILIHVSYPWGDDILCETLHFMKRLVRVRL